MKRIIWLAMFAVLDASAGSFTREVKEVRVYQDRVIVHAGGGYGTCGDRNGWFGWDTANPRHSDFLSMVLTAKATKTPLTFYDAGNACGGPEGAVGIEGLFWPEQAQ